MKKLLLLTMFVATTLTVLVGCEEGSSTPPNQVDIQTSTPEQTPVVDDTTTTQTTAPTGEYIGEVQAKTIALEHALLDESEVTALRVTFDFDDGIPEYEVEFYNGAKEYDYEIHAITGEIVGFDFEIEDKFFSNTTTPASTADTTTPASTTDTTTPASTTDTTTPASTTDTTTPASTPATTNEYIGENGAKAIALKHAGVTESEVTALRITFDFDDGVPEYEVEFYNGDKEYDYEIHATTGDIIGFDYEIADKFYTASNSYVTSNTVNSTNNTASSTSSTEYIGEAQAKSIALAHAGLTESQVTFVTVKFDFDDGIPEYEVEFYQGNKEYDYEINATTGAIIGFDYDIEQSYNSNQSSSTGNYIGEAQAKSIALAHAGVTESQVTFVTVKFDFDDGIPEYEVEFYQGNKEYDYEINATTGAIIGFDYDIEQSYNSNQSSSTGSYIGEAQAKSIALAHAGVTESQISNFKVEFDFDDGRAEYEIEWKIGRMEYDYEINATTGDIIKFEVDND